MNADVPAGECVRRAAEVVDALLRLRADNAPPHVVILGALRFVPERGLASEVHVATASPARAREPPALPRALLALPALRADAQLHDRFLATLVPLLLARGARVTLLAISSLGAGVGAGAGASVSDGGAPAASLAACLAALVGRPCALDARLVAQLESKRYTDALVETTGFFLYT